MHGDPLGCRVGRRRSSRGTRAASPHRSSSCSASCARIRSSSPRVRLGCSRLSSFSSCRTTSLRTSSAAAAVRPRTSERRTPSTRSASRRARDTSRRPAIAGPTAPSKRSPSRASACSRTCSVSRVRARGSIEAQLAEARRRSARARRPTLPKRRRAVQDHEVDEPLSLELVDARLAVRNLEREQREGSRRGEAEPRSCLIDGSSPFEHGQQQLGTKSSLDIARSTGLNHVRHRDACCLGQSVLGLLVEPVAVVDDPDRSDRLVRRPDRDGRPRLHSSISARPPARIRRRVAPSALITPGVDNTWR